MGLTVGIDLGTTYTVIAYIEPVSKKPQIIKNKFGNTTTPSIVGFKQSGEYVIGEEAREMAESGDEHVASFYKLHMGESKFTISHYGKRYTAKDLSSLFMKRLVKDAEAECGQKITHAVITVPAYFDDAAKNDTLKAGETAGLQVLNIINEPTAACVAYGLNESGEDKRILIYDLGGGTFDITIAEITRHSIRVLGTNGDHHLGGRDWDIALCHWISDQFLEKTGIDISSDNELVTANMVKAEIAKQQLSSSQNAFIKVDNGVKRVTLKLSRQTFEELTEHELTRTTDLIDETFDEIKFGPQKRPMRWSDLDGAILVGGSTKMPMVGNYIRQQNIPILQGIHPDEAVAVGAAIQANISQYCVIGGSVNKNVSSFALMGSAKMDYTLLPGAKAIEDVISHTLGMIMSSEDETSFVNDKMIARNTPVDRARQTRVRKLRVSKKKEKNQLDIYLLQGESDEPRDCVIAKKYVFTDIEYEAGGEASIDITFLHTINGTIDITASQHGRKLTIREEAIPEDMSWLDRSPREFREANAKVNYSGGLVLILDVSGSMYGAPLSQAKSAMLNFVNQFKDMNIDIGIAAFSNETAFACEPTRNMKTVMRAIGSLSIEYEYNADNSVKYSFAGMDKTAPLNAGRRLGMGTNSNPLEEVYRCLKHYRKDDIAFAIILTDGEWGKSASEAALKDKQRYVKDDLEIICMGFGEADIGFLRALSTRSDLAKVEDIAALNENLSTIARIIQN